MNIEQLIQENTAALARLTAAIEGMGATVTKAETAVAETKKPEKKGSTQDGKQSSGTAKGSPESSAPSEPGVATAAPMAYAELQAPGLKLYKTNREALVAILAHYKVAKLDQVPQDLWPEAKAKIEAELGVV